MLAGQSHRYFKHALFRLFASIVRGREKRAIVGESIIATMQTEDSQ
jgi:hypothetical protein